MKSYTILEALKAIQENTPFIIDDIVGITSNTKCNFIITMYDGISWFIDLDDFSYYKF